MTYFLILGLTLWGGGCRTHVSKTVVEQQTLYPYHFVDASAQFNGLGKHDMGLLVHHFKKYSGMVSVKQGEASNSVFKARVELVLRVLYDAGIDQERIREIKPTSATAGDIKERVIKIEKKERNSLVR